LPRADARRLGRSHARDSSSVVWSAAYSGQLMTAVPLRLWPRTSSARSASSPDLNTSPTAVDGETVGTHTLAGEWQWMERWVPRGDQELDPSAKRGCRGAASDAAALENGCRCVAGHLPQHHSDPVATRSDDSGLALGSAYARYHCPACAVDDLRGGPGGPAALGPVVESSGRLRSSVGLRRRSPASARTFQHACSRWKVRRCAAVRRPARRRPCHASSYGRAGRSRR
jgi:hypothetical protein